jgi:hypothetical protein
MPIKLAFCQEGMKIGVPREKPPFEAQESTMHIHRKHPAEININLVPRVSFRIQIIVQ